MLYCFAGFASTLTPRAKAVQCARERFARGILWRANGQQSNSPPASSFQLRSPEVVVIGAGLAGSEAAWQAAEHGAHVTLYEMRPAA